ncbi:hypothetical protein ACGFNX_10730 [Streptomyces sp. NPDC048723]|uniref:hypothetical protein n=1 Tax=Streptomyces sp. NPDC048723 TaxID=3365589 RepID=UPI003720D0DD
MAGPRIRGRACRSAWDTVGAGQERRETRKPWRLLAVEGLAAAHRAIPDADAQRWPRNATTIRLHFTWARPALLAWAADGRISLGKITRDHKGGQGILTRQPRLDLHPDEHPAGVWTQNP